MGWKLDIKDVMLQFDQIEQKVVRLIELNKLLEAENVKLAEKVNSLEAELKNRGETENRFLEQKAQIRSKIDSILAKLNSVSEK